MGAGFLAVGFALWQIQKILALSAGTPKMQEISQAILEGANAYLKKQYSVVAVVGVLALILAFKVAHFLLRLLLGLIALAAIGGAIWWFFLRA